MKKKTILYIDTSDNQKTLITLVINGQKKELIEKTDNWASQILLPLIDKLLEKNDLSFSQLTEIRVNTGPGSFTGLRVGVAVANTLGWLLGIPVNGQKDKFAEPHYK
jgi:tRNA threonylcarbamoyladenosine biosynthesis protein TsaB